MFACDSMTALGQHLQAMSYLEVMSDCAAHLGSGKGAQNTEIEALAKHSSMEKFNGCSTANKITQLLRLKYFQNLESTILELTKKRVTGLIAVLCQPETLRELVTTD